MRTHAHRLVAVASEIDPTIPLTGGCCPRLTPHKSWPTRGRAAAAGALIGGRGGRRGGGVGGTQLAVGGAVLWRCTRAGAGGAG